MKFGKSTYAKILVYIIFWYGMFNDIKVLEKKNVHLSLRIPITAFKNRKKVG